MRRSGQFAWIQQPGAGVGVAERQKLLRGFGAARKAGLNAETRQTDFQLIDAAVVQIRRRDHAIAAFGQGGEGQELRGMAGTGRQSGNAAFQRRDPLL